MYYAYYNNLVFVSCEQPASECKCTLLQSNWGENRVSEDRVSENRVIRGPPL